MSGRVAVVGSLNVDLVGLVDRHPSPGDEVIVNQSQRLAGGKGANQALAAAAAGAEVVMVGAVGDDSDGHAYRAHLARRGIDVAGVRCNPDLPTGLAVITIDADGENSIVLFPGANASLGSDAADWPQADLARLDPGDVVLVQLEIPLPAVEAVVRAAHDADLQVVLNAAPYRPVDPEALALADVVVANQHEALQLADAGLVVQSLLVTLGAAGASWDGEHRTGPVVPPPEVLDTTGAGDAFCGVLAAALARGADRDEALDLALAAGAAAVRHVGAHRDNVL